MPRDEPGARDNAAPTSVALSPRTIDAVSGTGAASIVTVPGLLV